MIGEAKKREGDRLSMCRQGRRRRRSPPRVVCALAATLVVSICGLRGLVGSFLVPCPCDLAARTGTALTSPPTPTRGHACGGGSDSNRGGSGGIRSRSNRKRRGAFSGWPMSTSAMAMGGSFPGKNGSEKPPSGTKSPTMVPHGVSGAAFRRRRVALRATACGRGDSEGDGESIRQEGGEGNSVRGEDTETGDRFTGRTARREGKGFPMGAGRSDDSGVGSVGVGGSGVRRGGSSGVGGGMDRAGFVRTVFAGLIAGPIAGGVMNGAGGGVPAAEAATLDRTRLGTPILTESILLDLLPISGVGANVLRAIQDEIEKATILRTLYRRVNSTQSGSVVEQLTVPPSVWDRVQSVAEGALEIMVENRIALEPVFREMDSAETQIRRNQYWEQVFATTKEALQRMAAGAQARLPPAVLSAQEDALLGLGRIGELFDSGFPFEINAGDMYDSIPRLLGRATVDVTVTRGPDGPKAKPKVLGNVTMVVDGYSSPVTAGNFIDLALRGFYNDLPIRFDGVPAEAQVGASNNETISTVVSGSYREGFVDPATGALRRLPLEILRVEKKGNAPVYGAARNTKVFTKAPAVQTFRIPGAIAMNHPALDGNGASSEFFWLQDENLGKDGYLMSQGVEALDGRYAIFAYAVGNRKLLGRLKDGDMIEKVTVTYGEDNLIRPKTASFKDLLLNGGTSEPDEE